jgi:TrmH family RNA methyltransferase
MITSTANARVRLLRGLGDRRARLRAGLFLVEGVRLAEEAVDAGVRPELVLYDEALRETERGGTLLGDLEALSNWMEAASPHVLATVSEVQHPQGVVLAVPFGFPQRPFRQRIGALHDVALILDDVADPGNAGTILRTARSSGVRQVYVTAGSVDVYGPKVVRAAAGAHFHLRIAGDFRWDNVTAALPEGTALVLAEAHAGTPYWALDWTRPMAVVVGGEAHGAGAAAKRAVTDRVRIPMPGGGDSLNVAMSAGVLLFEAVRQRSLRTGHS